MRSPATLRLLRSIQILFAGVLVASVLSVGDAGSADEPGSSNSPDWVPFIGEHPVGCTMGNPDPWGACANHHSYTGAIDLHLPLGEPTHSAGPGEVIYVNNTCAVGDSACQGGAGRWVGVQHENGQVSRYLHLDQVAVSAGQNVARGDLLGTAGLTGNALVAHVHYDEQKPLYTRDFIGNMYACHGDEVVVYPTEAGYDEWTDLPYGTLIRNDGYGCLAPVFDDVLLSSPFHDDIAWMDAEGISTGWPDNTFRPTLRVSRQAGGAWMYRIAGSPSGPFSDPGFWDVPTSHLFHTEISWMDASGMTTGYPDGGFRPLDCVTRASFVAFLHRDGGAPNGPFPPLTFADVDATHPLYREIAWAVSEGVSLGYHDNTWRPATCVTRQTAAALLFGHYG